LMTLHRKENVDDRNALAGILHGIEAAGRQTVFLVHPRTSKRITEFGLNLPPCIRAVEPQGYLEMLTLIQAASAVLTDSGGLQKEAYFLGKPCITLREETEWQELVEVGANVLTGADSQRIADAIQQLSSAQISQGIYGDGRAGATIARDLHARLYRGLESA